MQDDHSAAAGGYFKTKYMSSEIQHKIKYVSRLLQVSVFVAVAHLDNHSKCILPSLLKSGAQSTISTSNE